MWKKESSSVGCVNSTSAGLEGRAGRLTGFDEGRAGIVATGSGDRITRAVEGIAACSGAGGADIVESVGFSNGFEHGGGWNSNRSPGNVGLRSMRW